jgi:hypothetical protein
MSQPSAMTRNDNDGVASHAPALAVHRGTLLAGGIMWLAPLILLPAAILAFGQAELPLVAVMGGMGVLTAVPLVAAWRQTVELFPRHLVWKKWGRSRSIDYRDIADVRSGVRAQKAERSAVGLIEQRFLDLHLRDGETITFIEMSRHDALTRRLVECLAAVEQGAALDAAPPSRGTA